MADYYLQAWSVLAKIIPIISLYQVCNISKLLVFPWSLRLFLKSVFEAQVGKIRMMGPHEQFFNSSILKVLKLTYPLIMRAKNPRLWLIAYQFICGRLHMFNFKVVSNMRHLFTCSSFIIYSSDSLFLQIIEFTLSIKKHGIVDIHVVCSIQFRQPFYTYLLLTSKKK